MLPSIIAEEVKRCIEDFLLTTYPVQEPFFDNLFDNFFKANELFRGTYFTPLDLSYHVDYKAMI